MRLDYFLSQEPKLGGYNITTPNTVVQLFFLNHLNILL